MVALKLMKNLVARSAWTFIYSFKRRIAGMIFKLLSLFLMAVYLWGIWKFQKGYKKTNFSQSLPNRFALSLLWPALIFANKSYRKNFQKALKG